jgi:uncharacterized membrane protein YphA (DoxX/SURF4 family)
MTPLTNFIALIGRLLLAFIFVQASINKFGAIGGTVATMASHGLLPQPNILV